MTLVADVSTAEVDKAKVADKTGGRACAEELVRRNEHTLTPWLTVIAAVAKRSLPLRTK